MVCHFHFDEDEFNAKILAVHCELCSNRDLSRGDITENSFCRHQFLQSLPFIDIIFPCKFKTNDQSITIPASSMKLLKEYALNVMKYENKIQELIRSYPELKHKLYANPFEAYRMLNHIYKSTKKSIVRDLISSLERTNLITLLKPHLDDNRSPEYKMVYKSLLNVEKKPVGTTNFGNIETDSELLSTYDLGPFNIQIYQSPRFLLENFYRVVVSIDEILSPRILEQLFTQVHKINSNDTRLQNLSDLLDHKISDFQSYLISSFDELTELEQQNLALYATAQKLNLTKTMPLLLDDEVQEFYLDTPGCSYYLDHAKWGRCKSNLVPSNSELSHIITRLRLESRRPLDQKIPSLKTELKTKLFHVRAAVDIPPLAYGGPHLNFRKIRMRTLTLPELINNGTISLSAAAFLILCMTLRINITIGGEPSTGKTTLANAINLLAPPSWRRIAIEDALESISADEKGRHKVTFRVDPFDSLEKSKSTKSNEIIRLLHRSPDWVFLGEIQTAEHSAAMFHAISAGIRGIQTCHANSNTELLLRWRIHHNIPEVCFQSLGLLVHMVREVFQGQIIRKVAHIAEIQFHPEASSLLTLFEWNKSSEQLEQIIPDLISPLIIRACKFQQLAKMDIRKRFETYRQTLNSLVANSEYNPQQIVKTFDYAHSQLFSQTRLAKDQRTKTAKEDEAIRLHQIAG